jgi:predicted Co/Zn/Cd cation transporter (cation efflux family)
MLILNRGTVSPQFTRQLELDGVGRETNVELKFIVYQVEDERRVKQKDQIGYAESTLHSILATPQELPLVNTG